MTRAASVKEFAALGKLAKKLKEEQTRAAEIARQTRIETARRTAETNVFRNTLALWTDVVPLAPPNRVAPPSSTALPVPTQSWADEQDALQSTLSDQITPDSLLETDDSLSFCRDGISRETLRKLRGGKWVIQEQLDLHGLTREYAREELVHFLNDALKRGHRCVRVIHGKGLGSVNREPVLKSKVRHWLMQRDEVLAFTQARPQDGGSGALVVLLKL